MRSLGEVSKVSIVVFFIVMLPALLMFYSIKSSKNVTFKQVARNSNSAKKLSVFELDPVFTT